MRITLPALLALTLGLTPGFTRASIAASEAAVPVKLAGVWKLNKQLSDNPGTKMMEAMRNRGGFGGGRGGPGGGGMGGGGMSGGGRGGGGMGGGRGQGGGDGGGMGRGGRGQGEGAMSGGEPPLDGTSDGARPQGSEEGIEGGGGRHRGSRPNAEAGDSDGEQGGSRRRRGMGGPIPSPEFTIEQDGDSLAFRTERNLRLLHSDGAKRKKEGEMGKQEVSARFVKGALSIETKGEMGGRRKETYTLLPDGKLQVDFDIEGSGPVPGVKFKLVYDAAPAPRF